MKKVTGALAAFLYSTSALWGATLLPNGEQQFIDANGKPYASGKVYFYSNFPTCTVLKNTYQNEGGTVLNTNPVILSAAGTATIFGSGAYCQVLKDQYNNTIWTKYTSDTSSASNLGWGGTSGGTANAQTVAVSAFAGTNGQTFYFKAGYTNTSALTLTVNGGSAISVVRDTPTGTVALTGGEVVTGNIIGVTYDSGTGVFHLVTNNSRLFGFANSVPAAPTMDLNASTSHVVNVTGTGVSVSNFGAGGAFSFCSLMATSRLLLERTSPRLPAEILWCQLVRRSPCFIRDRVRGECCKSQVDLVAQLGRYRRLQRALVQADG
jgi:hypothetical protein